MTRRGTIQELALAVVAIFGLSFCGFMPVAAQELALREVVATKGSSELPFGSIIDILELNDGRILVSDDVVGVVHLWDPERNNLVRFARNGQGPGEVRVPSRMAAHPHGGFGIYDLGVPAMLLFDAEGRHERVVRLEGGIVSNPKSVAILGDGSFVIAGGRLTDPRHLHRYSSEGRYLESFGGPHRHLVGRMPLIQSAGGALWAHPEEGFIFSHTAPLRIERFRENSLGVPELLAEDLRILTELREDELIERIPGATVFRWWHDRTTGVVRLSDGRTLNVITRFYEGDSVWDLYSRDGTLETRTVVDRAYYLFRETAEGRLLASYRDTETDEHVAVVLEFETGR